MVGLNGNRIRRCIVRKLIPAVALLVLGTAACERTGENEYEVQTPTVGVQADTVRTPDVDVDMERDTINVPDVDVDVDTEQEEIRTPDVDVN